MDRIDFSLNVKNEKYYISLFWEVYNLVKKQDIVERWCSGQRIIQDKQVQRSERTQQPPLILPLAVTMRAEMANVT